MAPAPVNPPNPAKVYRQKVAELHEALAIPDIQTGAL
jgi:hypothetical protein